MECLDEKEITIYRGEALGLELDIFTPEMRVQKLLLVDEITVNFIDENGVLLSKNLATGVTIVDAEAGQIKVDLTAADTSILPEKDNQDFGVFIEYTSGEDRAVEFERALNVKKRTGGV